MTKKLWRVPRVLTRLLTTTILLLGGCDVLRIAGGFGGPAGPSAPGIAGPQSELADAQPSDQIARAIEEADIVKIVGDRLYALNHYRGLLIIDISNPDAPALLGEFDLRGRGVEMYVLGTQVYAILSADIFYFGPYVESGRPGASLAADVLLPPRPDFEGSQLAIVDATNAAAPVLKGKLNLAGFATQSRRVGDIIYVVGSRLVPFGATEDAAVPDAAHTDEGFVASVNVADPEHVTPVERKTFDGNALAIHVSEQTIFAAGQEYSFENDQAFTDIQVIDISDPAGAIRLRGRFQVPGVIRNRFYMDDFAGVFRIVTESRGFGFPTVRLFTFDLADLDHVTALGQVDIIQNESLEAVRFDGPRGYAVTFFRTDPLFVIDLRDPASPVVTGRLEVPGFSTHIEPRGLRLIAVGVDDTDGRRPAVAYYNVEDPANPTQLGRIVLGPPGSFTESDAVYDEKAFKIVDELGLIAVPFSHAVAGESGPGSIPPTGSGQGGSGGDVGTGSILPARTSCVNGVQLVDFDDAGLVQRGSFEHRGRVQRVGAIGGRVFALSQASFRTYNIDDRDHPAGLGSVQFFPENRMPLFDCDYYGIPIDIGPIIVPDDIFVRLLAALIGSGLCGTMGGAAPLLVLPIGLWLLRPLVLTRKRTSTPGRPRRVS